MSSMEEAQALLIAAAPATRLPLPDELHEEIFLLLDADDLVRAAAVCTAFNGLISAPDFRRLHRRRHHPPPILGFLEPEVGGLFLPPRSLRHSSTTPAAHAAAAAADFALSFLPSPISWRIRDAIGGRILLASHVAAAAGRFRDLVVCDPLHRRYIRVPQVPEHLAGRIYRSFGWFPFLVPAAGDEADEPAPALRVIWMVQMKKNLRAFAFSSTNGEWQKVSTFDGSTINGVLLLSRRHYAHGCVYWTSQSFHDAIMLDMRELKFSVVQLPHASHGRVNLVVEEGEGSLGSLILRDNAMLDLYCRTWQGNNGVGAGAEWHLRRTIPLPDNSLVYTIIAASDGYLLMQAFPLQFYLSWEEEAPAPQMRYFTLKLKTWLVEELFVPVNKHIKDALIYANFPPPLALPTV